MQSTAHAEDTHFTDSGASHIAPPRVYFITWLILLFLMFLTVVAGRQDFGAANNFIALGIAVTKASLVIMFFMQVKGSSKLTIFWATLGFVWLSFLFTTLADQMTRHFLPVIGWQ